MSEKGFGETERKIEPLCLCAASQDCLCNFRRKRGERELAGCLHPPAACGDYGNTVSSNTNPNDQGSSSSRAEYGETRPLNLNRKVFLSHSGRDKNFVQFLHQELCRQYHDDRFVFFFDEDSLPTAEPISMENILLEARGCELGVLVLSDDFFTHTRNPMLELEALTASEVRLLPLFYKISVDGFNEARNQSRWEERWKEWSGMSEERIEVWRNALQYVNRYSGPEYSKRATNEVEYIDLIVKEVTRIIRPRILYSEEGVYGMDRLCKIVDGMYNECASERSSDDFTLALSTRGSVGQAEDGAGDSLDLVGIYGFTGLGKTTLCKSLCDFYFAQFNGKVGWIDLGSLPSDPVSSPTYSSTAFAGRIHYLLTKLAGHINDVHSLSFSEVQNLLKATICYRKEPLFLAIDNILPDLESLEEANFYLSCKLPKDSKIFITAKSKEILEVVVREHTKFSVVLEHIPSLDVKEATTIFMHKFSEQSIANKEIEVEAYVSMCHIHEHWVKYYHPLMLKSLAASIRHDRSCHVDWKRKLRELQSAVALGKNDAWEMVFKALDITYGVLKKEEQKVFLDLALYYRTSSYSNGYEWYQCVHSHCHKKSLDKILSSLADRAFINWKHGSHINRMHDLMVDFSIFKLSEDAMGCNLHNYYLVLDNGSCLQNQLLANAMRNHEWPSSLPKSVRTVSISGGICSGSINQELDLRNLEGMEVLHMVDNPGLREVLLSPTSVAHLRSFIVRVPPGSPPLCFILDEAWSSATTAHQESMPGGPPLAWVELEGNIIFKTCRRGRSLLANNFVLQSFQSWWQRLSSAVPVFELGSLTSLRNLQYLSLSQIPAARSIDLTTCSNLKRLILESMPSLTRIHGLEKSTKLENLHVFNCNELVELSILVIDMRQFYVVNCRSLERIALHTTPYCIDAEAGWTQPSIVYFENCTALRTVDGITQFSGIFSINACEDVKGGYMQEAMQALVGSIERDSSKFRATVKSLSIGVQHHPLPRLAGVTSVEVEDVQHASLLISALCKVQGADLFKLAITCKADSSCGCDKNVPQFESLKLRRTGFRLHYHCRQVRDLTSLARVGNRLKCLNLRGCRSVEVWPNFATMTSITKLNLSYTSLEEWPMGVQLLPLLVKLDIRGCVQLPEKEMVKGITCKSQPAGSSGCSRGALASLLADLKDHRRDRGSVADALHSNGPVLETLLREQWPYLCNSTMSRNLSIIHGAELCLLIMLMYYVWFGEVEDHNMSDVTDSSESSGPSATMKKMKELLCSEIFMSLPFDAWSKGGAVDSCERYMAVALIGAASIGYFNVPVNDDLKDQIVNFLQPFVEAPQCVGSEADMLQPLYLHMCSFGSLKLDRDEHEMLAMRVGNAVCKMVRVPNVAAALGQDFRSITMDGLQAKYIPKAVSDLECIVEAREPSVVPELGEEPTPTTMDSLRARVLRMVMLKIMPFSILVLLSRPTHERKPFKLKAYLPV